jgi:hypothetical protein
MDEGEFGKNFVHPKEGRTLIVGSYICDKPDRRLLYNNVVGVDMRAGPGVDVVANMEEPQPQLGKFSHIECLSVLEHSRKPWLLAAQLETMLEPEGTIHVQVPFNWWVHNYPDDYFRMSLNGIREIFPGILWSVMLYLSHDGIHSDPKRIPSLKKDGARYHAKSLACGFGIKRA